MPTPVMMHHLPFYGIEKGITKPCDGKKCGTDGHVLHYFHYLCIKVCLFTSFYIRKGNAPRQKARHYNYLQITATTDIRQWQNPIS